MSNFTVLTTQRTGSTWVIDMLNSHPQIKAYSELFKNDGVGYPKWGGAKDYPFFNEYCKSLHNKTSKVLGDYLDELFTDHKLSTGFKLMYNQYDSVLGLAKYIDKKHIKIIHLYRNNLFELYLSVLIAKRSQIYHSKKNLKYKLDPFMIDVNELMVFVKKKKDDFNRFKTKYEKSNYLDCEYEKLFNNPKIFEEILNFIGVEKYPLSSELIKLNSLDKRNLIINYGEVEKIIHTQDCMINS